MKDPGDALPKDRGDFPWPKADECRWPKGDPSTDDLTFCKAPVRRGAPYCPEHCARAYQKAKPKEGEAGSGGARRRGGSGRSRRRDRRAA